MYVCIIVLRALYKYQTHELEPCINIKPMNEKDAFELLKFCVVYAKKMYLARGENVKCYNGRVEWCGGSIKKRTCSLMHHNKTLA